MVTTFTLDTNCIISLEERRPSATAIDALIAAHLAGRADVALVAISASERQIDGQPLESFKQFSKRIREAGLGQLGLLFPMFYWDITFWDRAIWSDDAMEAVERQIHEILFPSLPFLWNDYCEKSGIDPTAPAGGANWNNAKCDVQAYWAHTWNKRNVFVTSDKNFHAQSKRAKLLALFGGQIATPEGALDFL